MLEINNTKVFGLDNASKVARYPMSTNIDELDIDYKRLISLSKSKAGSGHDTALSGILVQCDIKFPLYWLKQFQRYHFVQINSSQSTMHRIAHMDIAKGCNEYVDPKIIYFINKIIKEYIKCGDHIEKHELFMRIISNLPSGFEMWMGVTTNYQQLKTIWLQRRNHKLDDWGIFCRWIEDLPLFKFLCLRDINWRGNGKF